MRFNILIRTWNSILLVDSSFYIPGASYDEGLNIIRLLHILLRYQTIGIMHYIFVYNVITSPIIL